MRKKIELIKFQPYIDKAIQDCERLSFAEKSEGLWSEPQILEYFNRIATDEPNECIASALKELLPDVSQGTILCVGGGTGKLGRNILNLYPGLLVTEVDSAREMVDQANSQASKQGLADRFISIKADARLLPFKDNEFDYAIGYGVFRYIDPADQKQALSEIGRVSNDNFTVAEPILTDLIYSLRDKLGNVNSSIKETAVSVFRMSLFYMLFKEYKKNEHFKMIVDNEITDTADLIEVLTSVAGMSAGILYELRARNIENR